MRGVLQMGRDKVRLIRGLTRSGVNVLVSDIDVVWLRNPLPFFKRYPVADVLVSSDQLRSETMIESLKHTSGLMQHCMRPYTNVHGCNSHKDIFCSYLSSYLCYHCNFPTIFLVTKRRPI